MTRCCSVEIPKRGRSNCLGLVEVSIINQYIKYIDFFAALLRWSTRLYSFVIFALSRPLGFQNLVLL